MVLVAILTVAFVTELITAAAILIMAKKERSLIDLITEKLSRG